MNIRKISKSSFTFISRSVFIFATLKSFSELNSLSDLRIFIEGIFEDVQIIFDWLQKIIHIILIPWNLSLKTLYDILPLEVPVYWQNTIIILVSLIMTLLVTNTNHQVAKSINRFWPILKELEETLDTMPKTHNISLIIDKFEQIWSSGANKYLHWFFGPYSDYILALQGKDLKQLELKRMKAKKYLIDLRPSLNTMLHRWASKYKVQLFKLKFIVILCILIIFDFIIYYDYSAYKVLGFVAMVSLGFTVIVFLFSLLLGFLFIRGVKSNSLQTKYYLFKIYSVLISNNTIFSRILKFIGLKIDYTEYLPKNWGEINGNKLSVIALQLVPHKKHIKFVQTALSQTDKKKRIKWIKLIFREETRKRKLLENKT